MEKISKVKKSNFAFGKGSSFWVWWGDLSPALTYHCSAHPIEVDRDELSTLRHTFFDRLFLDRVVEGSSGWGSGESQSGLPSWACWITNLCSSLWRDLKNMLSTLMRNWISPAQTSILALTSFRKGHPRMRSKPRSPSMSRTMKSARTKWLLIHTYMFSTIPSGCRTVESASCTKMRVWERAGYCNCSKITLGIMFMLDPRLQRARL